MPRVAKQKTTDMVTPVNVLQRLCSQPEDIISRYLQEDPANILVFLDTCIEAEDNLFARTRGARGLRSVRYKGDHGKATKTLCLYGPSAHENIRLPDGFSYATAYAVEFPEETRHSDRILFLFLKNGSCIQTTGDEIQSKQTNWFLGIQAVIEHLSRTALEQKRMRQSQKSRIRLV